MHFVFWIDETNFLAVMGKSFAVFQIHRAFCNYDGVEKLFKYHKHRPENTAWLNQAIQLSATRELSWSPSTVTNESGRWTQDVFDVWNEIQFDEWRPLDIGWFFNDELS